jgi:MoxR-like ATPase
MQVDSRITKLEDNMNRVMLGKPDVIRMCIIAVLSGEHILLEDVPGVGKTLAGKALAKSVSGEFHRIQFTPDLLPSDIVGSSVFNSNTSEFIFEKGPIFANVVLADEINRAPPRTQSALLEAMSDSQVTVDGTTYDLPDPFTVIATQNPFEFEGTYVLPESQLDRFLLRVAIGYPDREHERQVLSSHRAGEPVDSLQPAISLDEVRALQTATREVRVDDSITEYVLSVAEATRNSPDLNVGISTRGVLLWYRAGQALALLSGRDYVTPDDIKWLGIPVLAHRVMGRGLLEGSMTGETRPIIQRILNQVPAPV